MEISIIKQTYNLTKENVNTKPLKDLRKPFRHLFGQGKMKELAEKFNYNSRYVSVIFAGTRKNETIENVVRQMIYNKLFESNNDS